MHEGGWGLNLIKNILDCNGISNLENNDVEIAPMMTIVFYIIEFMVENK